MSCYHPAVSVVPATIRVPAAVQSAGQAPQYLAMASICKLVADACNDYQAFRTSGGGSALAAFAYFGNLAPDVVAVVVNAANLPKELTSLSEDGLSALLDDFQTKVDIPNERARKILHASMEIAKNVRNDVYGVVDLINAIKG